MNILWTWAGGKTAPFQLQKCFGCQSTENLRSRTWSFTPDIVQDVQDLELNVECSKMYRVSDYRAPSRREDQLHPSYEDENESSALNWSAPECNRVSEYRAPCKVGAKSNTRLGSSRDAEVTIFESVSSSNSYSRSRVDRIVCRGTRNSDLRAEKILSEKWFLKDRKVPRITESSTNDTSKQYQRC